MQNMAVCGRGEREKRRHVPVCIQGESCPYHATAALVDRNGIEQW